MLAATGVGVMGAKGYQRQTTKIFSSIPSDYHCGNATTDKPPSAAHTLHTRTHSTATGLRITARNYIDGYILCRTEEQRDL